jgi:hypothetical protein
VTEPMVYRSFRSEDLPEVMRIQEDNLANRLSSLQKADGFLSVAFPQAQFVQMHAEIPMAVADRGSRLGGYMCGSSLASSAQVPLLARMMSLFPAACFKDRPLDQYQSFIYGPVCIDRPLRGTGVLQGLFRQFLLQLQGRFELGALFVSLDNPRSLRAHVHKLGMTKLCDFSFEGRSFGLLVFDAVLQDTKGGAHV